MKKWLLIASLFLATPVEAQVQLNVGQPELIFNANNTAAPQVGTVYAIPTQANQLTWIISFGTQPASHSTILELSNDNVIWATADTSTNVLGESRNIFTAARFVRATESARSGGSAITISVIAKQGATSNISSGVVFPALFNIGDILVANSTSTLTNLPTGITGYWLGSNGTTPGWTNAINTSGTIATSGTVSGLSITGTNGISSGAAGFLSIATRGYWQATANGIWELLRADGTFGVHYEFAGVPVIGACGTSPSVSTDATNVSGTITVGSANPTSCVLTFNGTWNKAPRCVANTITATAADVRALGITTSTTVLTITPATAFATTTSIGYHCESSK